MALYTSYWKYLRMARQKTTLSLDRTKADAVRALLAAKNISDAIDTALDRILYEEEVRRSIAGYVAIPPTAEEDALARRPHPRLDDDDTDWRAAYADLLQ
jgi:hypothetical protein